MQTDAANVLAQVALLTAEDRAGQLSLDICPGEAGLQAERRRVRSTALQHDRREGVHTIALIRTVNAT